MPSMRCASSAMRDVHIVGRRGPHQASFTTKEAGELGHLERAHPIVRPGDFPPLEADAALEPGHRKMVTHLRSLRRRWSAATSR